MTVTIKPDEFVVWRRYVHEISGIALADTKAYLLETRLSDLIEKAGCKTFSEFHACAKADATNAWRRKIIDSITTNETSFFRDAAPFELLKHKLVPELIDRRRNGTGKLPRLRIWSAACSTGQEVYSIAIALKELLGDPSAYDIQILGTDISDRVVAQASYGEFSQLELERGLSADKLPRYFNRNGDRWRIRDELRSLAVFRTMNLLVPFQFPSPFDIVFCRNVAIYFNDADKGRLFANIRRYMAPDGSLIIGSTESLATLCPELEPKRYLRSVFYQTKS